MLFFEPVYIFLFFPLVLIFFYFSENKYDLKILLIIFSLLFYSYWNIKYVPLLLLFVFSNFIFGKLLLKNSKKLILLFAISFNILILILFKYIDFIILNLNLIFKTNIKIFDLPFPLAVLPYDIPPDVPCQNYVQSLILYHYPFHDQLL